MNGSSLLKLIKALSDDDIKGLKKHLKCHAILTNKHSEQLFLAIIKYRPTYKPTFLKAEKIYNKIFPKGIPYQRNAANFRKIISDLKKDINQYLVWNTLKQDSDYEYQLLLKAYIQRNINAPAFIDKLTRHISTNENEISASYFLNRHYIYKSLYQKDNQVLLNLNHRYFLPLNNNLDYFYILTKLKLMLEAQRLKKNQIANYELEASLLPLKYIEEKRKAVPIIIQLYSKIYLYNEKENPSTTDFGYFFNLFSTNISKFHKSEIYQLATALYNFTNLQIRNNKDVDFYKKYRFEIFKLGLQYNIYMKKKIFPNKLFSLIINAAGDVGAFDWAFQFIETYTPYLSETARDLEYANAKGAFYYLKASQLGSKADFEASIKAYKEMKDRNPTYNKIKIWILLRCYYEYFVKHDHQEIFAYTDNFHVLVQRSKALNRDEKRALLNTKNAVKFLIKARYSSKISIEKAKQKIDKIRNASHYEKGRWLMPQIEEFITFKFAKQIHFFKTK